MGMSTHSFEIAQAFPADKPVARFVTGLALISNELRRLKKLMPQYAQAASDEERGVRVMLFRHRAAACHEAVLFIEKARTSYSAEIPSFIDGLSAETKAQYERLMAAVDPTSPFYMAWLRQHRDWTFHVPEIHPAKFDHDRDGIGNALKRAASEIGTTTNDGDSAGPQFGFADKVSVWIVKEDDDEQLALLNGAWNALGGFVHETVCTYLRRLPPGVVTVRP
jgi:hypothetical protein